MTFFVDQNECDESCIGVWPKLEFFFFLKSKTSLNMNSAFFLFPYSTTIQRGDYQNIPLVPEYKRTQGAQAAKEQNAFFFFFQSSLDTVAVIRCLTQLASTTKG